MAKQTSAQMVQQTLEERVKQTPEEIAAVCASTPTLTVFDARKLAVREVHYYRRDASEQSLEPRITSHSYDAGGRLMHSLDPRLLERQGPTFSNLSTSYSLGGQPLYTDSVDAGWQIQWFGASGQRLSTFDSRGTSSHIEYDQQLRPIAVYERLADEQEHEDTRGRCIERYHYGDLTADAQSNQRGKLLRQDDPAGMLLIDCYDLTGGIQSQTRHFLKETAVLNWPEAEAKRKDLWGEEEGSNTTSQYSALGEILCLTDAFKHQRHYCYNVAGQLDTGSIQLQGAEKEIVISDLHYAAHGALIQEKAGNKVLTKHTCDPANLRLTHRKTTHPDGTVLQDLTYAYDPVGNVLQVHDKEQATRCQFNEAIKPTCDYQYDSFYQLIKASGRECMINRFPQTALPQAQVPLLQDATVLRNYTRTYTYDAGGNVVKLAHTGHQDYTLKMEIAFNSNRVLRKVDTHTPDFAPSFDARGNLRTLQPYGRDLVWNGRNQLQCVSLVEREGEVPNDEERYHYDGQGQRLRKLRITKAQKRIHQEDVRYLPELEYRQNSATQEALQVITFSAGSMSVRVLHWTDGQPMAFG